MVSYIILEGILLAAVMVSIMESIARVTGTAVIDDTALETVYIGFLGFAILAGGVLFLQRVIEYFVWMGLN